MLQTAGLVDAVLSEDVDTLMFGCGLSLRNWTSEGTKGSKSPTHVNVYEAAATKNGISGLDRNGMILVALMSGGDYIPAGVPGCGIKMACEAARAGFGADLCKLSRKDRVGLRQWRERLKHEFITNESHFFRCKYKSLKIPEGFPDTVILGYYTHPVVSSPEGISQLSNDIQWNSSIDITGLRLFVAEAFEWQNLAGAKKFVRGLAPALLTRQLRLRGELDNEHDDLERKERVECEIITNICGRRSHFVNDGMPEYRVTYTPANIVGLDLGKEKNSDFLSTVGDDSENAQSEPENPNPLKRSRYDPTEPEKIWLLETWVKVGVPLMAENWEESMRNPKKRAGAKARQQASSKGKKQQTIDFARVGKPGVSRMRAMDAVELPAVVLAKYNAGTCEEQSKKTPVKNRRVVNSKTKMNSAEKLQAYSERDGRSSPPSIKDKNPWTLAKRPSDTYAVTLASGKRYSALGIIASPELNKRSDAFARNDVVKGHTSSPTPHTPKKHMRPSSTSLSECKTNEIEPTYSTNSRRIAKPSSNTYEDPCTPSPRKKRTPTKDNCDEIQAQGLPIPAPSKQKNKESSSMLCDMVGVEPLTSKKVNRKLTFSPIQHSPASSSSSLPSPSALLSPRLLLSPTKLVQSRVSKSGPSNSTLLSSWLQNRREGQRIVLRDSLDGAWKKLEDWEVDERPGRTVYKDIEVLDLTGD